MGGELNLHGHDEHLLSQLGLGALYKGLSRSDVRSHNVQRRQILHGIARSLLPGTIQHSTRFEGLNPRQDGRFSLVLEQNGDKSDGYDDSDDDDSARGAIFDVLVLAFGLSGSTWRLIPGREAATVGLIGDARMQFSFEPFFGW